MLLFADSLLLIENTANTSDRYVLKHEGVLFISSLFMRQTEDDMVMLSKNYLEQNIIEVLEESDAMHLDIETVLIEIFNLIENLSIQAISSTEFLCVSFIYDDMYCVISNTNIEMQPSLSMFEQYTSFNKNDVLYTVRQYPLYKVIEEQHTQKSYITWKTHTTINKDHIQLIVSVKIIKDLFSLLGHRFRVLLHNIPLKKEIKVAAALMGFVCFAFLGAGFNMPVPSGIADQVQSLTNQFIGNISSLENQNQFLRKETIALQNAAETSQFRIVALCSENNNLEYKLEEAQKDCAYKEQLLKLKTDELASLKQRVLELEYRGDAFAAFCDFVVMQLDLLNGADNIRELSTENLIERLLKLRSFMEQHQYYAAKPQQALSSQYLDSNPAAQSLISSYEQKLSKYNTESIQLQHNIMDLSSKLEKAHGEIISLEAKCAQQKEELIDIQQALQMASGSTEELYKNNLSLKSENKALRNDITNLNARINECHTQLKSSDKIIQHLYASANSLIF